MNYGCKYNSPIGEITMVSDGRFLICLSIEGQSMPFKELEFKENLYIFELTKKWLDEYFEGNEPKIKIPIKLNGTDFRKEVWNILLEIPYGKTITYGEIAKKIAEKRHIIKMSAQAVGGAVGHNPISIIVPCHRVLGANKNITGYGGGLHLKRELLKIEKIEWSE